MNPAVGDRCECRIRGEGPWIKCTVLRKNGHYAVIRLDEKREYLNVEGVVRLDNTDFRAVKKLSKYSY